MKDKVSVIVPCFNTEKYIEECVKSIVSQTYKNLEIILVDDGSTDKTSELVDGLKKTDDRIVVVHQKNAGLSAARNTGLKKANGKYVAFIDSDDCVAKNYIERLLAAATETKSDIVACAYVKFSETSPKTSLIRGVKTMTTLTGFEAFKDYLTTKNIGFSMSCNKLYNIELFKDVKFPEGRLHEDEYTTYKLYYQANRLTVIPDGLYFYRMRENSITKSDLDEPRLIDILDQIEDVKAFVKKNDIKDVSDYLSAYEINVKNFMLKRIVDEKIKTEKKDELIDFLKSKKSEIYHNKYVTKLPKLMYPFLGFYRRKK